MSADKPVSTVKRCPSCRGRMQRFFAMGVELDRCRACRGVWLDAGELSDVLMRELTPRLAAGRSERLCASCERPLRAARLPGDIPVETCERCQGLYLDEGELEQLSYGTDEVAPQAANVSSERRFFFFYCVACSERFPLHEGRNGEGGLHCPGCAPAAQPPAAGEEQPVNQVGGWLSRWLGRST